MALAKKTQAALEKVRAEITGGTFVDATTGEIAKRLGLSEATAYRVMTMLLAEGLQTPTGASLCDCPTATRTGRGGEVDSKGVYAICWRTM